MGESFYDVKYLMSIIMSNVCQINLSNENIKNQHWCFQISKIVSQNHFGILSYLLSWKQLFEIYFRLLRRNNKLKINNFLTNIWHDNWSCNIWRRKRTPLLLHENCDKCKILSVITWKFAIRMENCLDSYLSDLLA